MAATLMHSLAHAAGAVAPMALPGGVRMELPRGWTIASSAVEEKSSTGPSSGDQPDDRAGAAVVGPSANGPAPADQAPRDPAPAPTEFAAPRSPAFSANYYVASQLVAMVNLTYHADQRQDQAAIRALTAAEVAEVDRGTHAWVAQLGERSGFRVIQWLGTSRRRVADKTALVIEYLRASSVDGAAQRVRLIRVIDGPRSFTLTLACRIDREVELWPMMERMIDSIRS